MRDRVCYTSASYDYAYTASYEAPIRKQWSPEARENPLHDGQFFIEQGRAYANESNRFFFTGMRWLMILIAIALAGQLIAKYLPPLPAPHPVVSLPEKA